MDSSLRILWVGGDWDDFARNNGGARALSNTILSTRLTAHIADTATADRVSQMVQAVLATKRPLHLDYRCDAPHQVRRFRLTIQPMKHGRAVMVHQLLDAVQVDPPMAAWLYDPLARSQKCSVCGAVYVNQTWLDPTLPEVEHPSKVGYTTCPTCDARIAAALRELVETGPAPEFAEGVLRQDQDRMH
ncbi:MAG: hypothetical protein JXR75_04380 [Rhodobacteraceae bacterium]|nr:hypothetical protein [Paracoccaceae bacterium]